MFKTYLSVIRRIGLLKRLAYLSYSVPTLYVKSSERSNTIKKLWAIIYESGKICMKTEKVCVFHTVVSGQISGLGKYAWLTDLGAPFVSSSMGSTHTMANPAY